MFRLVFCLAVVFGVLWVPLMNAGGGIAASETEWNHENVGPIERLGKCQSAQMEVYFHDLYITTNSAESIFDGILATNECKKIKFEIIPLVPENADKEDVKLTMQQAKELREYIRVTGYKAKIKRRVVDSEDPLGSTGRAALLRITVKGETPKRGLNE